MLTPLNPYPVNAEGRPAPARPDRGASFNARGDSPAHPLNARGDSPAHPLNARGDSPAHPLNYRQEKFCAQYSLSGNAAEAARLVGYSERSAYNHGARLTRDARVRARVYELRVNRAIQFGPVMAFTRLEHLYHQASEAKDYRAAAAIVTLQARLSGVESWTPPSAVVRDRQQGEANRRRSALSPKGADPFDNLSELAATETMNADEG